ncbi:LysR family transcriptional regulator [Acinetobacter colistiniresistens]|uniref:LysR family transcriptional regulator n=1 Tax=Acinetobacter colistiniresistens TaxID=280145 RepID=UPI00211C2CB2|nr:LysR family transcriptional regulator [Acinetobacter colistiniresistens]UUM26578.1 LysR family transcriptional regulator [Acinetobacter colistiniresistens]
MATDRLGDMRLFVEATELKSLSAAGRKLGISPAAASARLIKLEATLQSKLFDRTTRSLRLTDEGQVFLRYSKIALQAINDAEVALLDKQATVKGKLRISASVDLGRNLLSPWIEEFSLLHSDLNISLTLTDSNSNLIQDNVDIAIRFGLPDNDLLVARFLAPNWRVLCASPEYLKKNGIPKTPEDLIHHKFIVLVTESGPLNEYYFSSNQQDTKFLVKMDEAWETNDSVQAKMWAIAGHGITRKTIWDITSEVRKGTLELILTKYIRNEAGIYAVMHKNKYIAPRMRAFLDFLIKKFENLEANALRQLPHP